MIYISDLRPAFLEELETKLKEPAFVEEFLAAITKFLNEATVDNGPGSDEIYMAARMLTSANAWNHVSSTQFCEACRDAPDDAVTIFLEGITY